MGRPVASEAPYRLRTMKQSVDIFPRPTADDCADYWRGYCDLVQSNDVLAALAGQAKEVEALLGAMDEERGNFAYASGKWSIKEVIGHLLDSERIFAVRALAIARGEAQDMFGFEQDDYVRQGSFIDRTVASLLAEYSPMRASNLAMLASLSAEQAARTGTASGSNFTARTYPWLIAGHEAHHLSVIAKLY